MAKVTAMKQAQKPTVKPQANYKWEPTDVFEITGQQFAHLYHCLSREISDPAGCSIAMKFDAYNAIMDLFVKGVEQGVIVEVNDVQEVDVEEVKEHTNKLFGETRDPASIPHWHPNSLG